MGLREYLLGWVFSSIKGEHGFALHLARNGAKIHKDPLFNELIATSRGALSSGFLIFARKALTKTGRIIFGEKK